MFWPRSYLEDLPREPKGAQNQIHGQSPSSDNDDPIEKILRQREREREVAINSVTQSSQEFRQILDEFWNQPRVERTVDILKY